MNEQAPRPASLRLSAVASAVGNLSFFGVVFLLTPIAIRAFGEDGWGIWQLVGATTAYSALLNCGQVCTSTERVYVPGDRSRELTEALVDFVRTLRLGPGLSSETDVGPMIGERYREILAREHVTLEVSEHGGHVGFIEGGTPWRPRFYLPGRLIGFLEPLAARPGL